MLDIKILRDDPEKVKLACKNKNADVDIDRVLTLDSERRRLRGEIDELNQERKKAAQAKDIEEGKRLKGYGSELEAQLNAIETEFTTLMLSIPNLPSDDTPVGKDEAENVVLRNWGEPPEFDFVPKDHLTIGSALGLIDSEKAVQVSGVRFTYLKGAAVLLQYALAQLAFSVLTDQDELQAIIKKAKLSVSAKPFTPVAPPLMIRPDVFQKMARLEPKEERYYIPSDDAFLIGSAEHTLGPLHMGETLKEAELPARYVAFTPAFRREAGSYGKDTKGILRLHQFDKVEMESFSTPDNGLAEQDFFVALQEHFMQTLDLPYQVVMTCTGDQGDPDARHLDIETWMPGQGKYRETHSADYMTDYQARRLNTKVKRADGSLSFVHMNDATAFAVGRTLIAILENYQNADGSVTVPEALAELVGFGLLTA
ncbi:serine--tRNA ligase [Candidatus Uhrbacteria bacterium]|nr:serine--tRNA ligase [Candidatus Uhrbacteria bacterium]